MKLFQRFLTPKWKHKDPGTRKQALINLDLETSQAIFLDIANNDPVSELRQLATKRLNHLDKLLTIAAHSSDTKVKDLATKIINQVLAGSTDAQTAFSLDEVQRINHINGLDENSVENQNSLEFIARNGDSAIIRSSAIHKINREALLGDLAINDPDRQIRILSAEKLHQKSTLERVYKAVKNKDKQISKIVKSRLESIIAEEQRPKKLLAQQKALCASMAQLGTKGLWERDKIQFDQISEQWNKIADEAIAEYQSKFDDAAQQFNEKYHQYLQRNKARLEMEAALQPLKAEKNTLLAQLEELLSTLNQPNQSAPIDIPDIRHKITQVENQWQSIILPEDHEAEFLVRFNAMRSQIHAMLNNIEALSKTENELRSLHKKISNLLKTPFKLDQASITAIEKKLDAIRGDTTDLQALKSDVIALLEKAKTCIQNNLSQAKQLISSSQTLLASLENALTRGEIKNANDSLKQIQKNIKQLDKLGKAVDAQRLSDIKSQTSEFTANISELNKWRNWANTPQKERLISEIEALIDSDLDPKEIAFLVSKARKDWQKLGASEPDSSQQLWERFNQACDKAYEPCKQVFSQEAAIRAENYGKRLAFLNDLETFVHNANWDSVDWRKVENLFQHARSEWHNLGTIDKDKRKAVNTRFNSAHAKLKDKLSGYWKKNQLNKQKIIDEAKKLADLDDLHSAVISIKRLQQQWKTAGHVQHRTEKKLWAEFRQYCDIIFARRDSAAIQKAENNKQLSDKKATLCADLTSLCNTPSKEILRNKESILQLKKQIGELPSGDAKTEKIFGERVTHALQIFERKLDTAKRIAQMESLCLLKSKADFIQQLETQIEQRKSIDWDLSKSQFNMLDPVPRSDWNRQINARFTAAHSITSDSAFCQAAEDNIADIRSAIIQLEIIAEIDSPSDDAAVRLQIQARRLKDKLGRHDEENSWDSFLKAEAAWLLIGPLSTAHRQYLEKRHDAVIAKLKQQFPEELENY